MKHRRKASKCRLREEKYGVKVTDGSRAESENSSVDKELLPQGPVEVRIRWRRIRLVVARNLRGFCDKGRWSIRIRRACYSAISVAINSEKIAPLICGVEVYRLNSSNLLIRFAPATSLRYPGHRARYLSTLYGYICNTKEPITDCSSSSQTSSSSKSSIDSIRCADTLSPHNQDKIIQCI